MRIYKTPALARLIWPEFVWKVPTKEKIIYLTFDDGPIPDVTDFVLEELEKFDALATFFCVGENIQKNPAVFKKVIQKGHSIGNHTFNHLNGWKTNTQTYLENIQKCDEAMKAGGFCSEEKILFRPPYGKISNQVSKTILPEKEIVMWDVLTADYDQNLSAETCLKKTIKYTKSGSIVLFHDSVKSEKRLKVALPGMLEHFSNKGYTFEAL